ncbi:MAG TPA: hypothetical protein VIT20_07235 [Propionibacteriaceae bacterium]
MKKAVLAVVATAVMTAAGCSGGSTPAPAESASGPSAASSPSAAASAPASSPATPAPSGTSTAPASDCLTGTYRLARFVGVGDKATYGTGEGGDVEVAFDDDAYTLTAAGKEAIKLTLAGQTAELKPKGTIKGTWTGSGAQVTFTVGDAEGSARLTAGGQERDLTMAEVGSVVAPDGLATLACGNDKVVMVFDDIRLEFER